MHIQVLYFEKCPNYLRAVDNLNTALKELSRGRDAKVTLELVKNQAEAEEIMFVGSPQIMVEHRDLFGTPADATYGLRCRIYLFGGKALGTPTVADFKEALKKLPFTERHA